MARPRRVAARSLPSWSHREKILYALSDQDVSPLLSAAAFGVAGRDQSWNPHADAFIAANRVAFESLELTTEIVPTANEIGLRLRSGGSIGAVPLRSPDTRKIRGGVVVSPRFGWDGIGKVLQLTGWAARPRVLQMPLVPGSAREVPPWVLAGPVLQRFAELLREMRRGFHFTEEVRESPRGEILWSRYVTEQAGRAAFHRVPCRYPDLGRDQLLRSYVRWGITRVRQSLVQQATADVIARALVENADALLYELRDVGERTPSHSQIDEFSRGGVPSAILRQGLQALGWVVDERGLAGATENDGLAWSLPMHELFERWVERIARAWAHEIGAEVRTGRQLQTVVPIEWEPGAHSSMKSLAPDVVLRHGETVFVIDAKYKGHFQELDDTRWMELQEELRTEHRHDIHQILAYAALFDAVNVVAVLAYPMHAGTWTRLSERGGAITHARIHAAGRSLTLALAGFPMQLAGPTGLSDLTHQLSNGLIAAV